MAKKAAIPEELFGMVNRKPSEWKEAGLINYKKISDESQEFINGLDTIELPKGFGTFDDFPDNLKIKGEPFIGMVDGDQYYIDPQGYSYARYAARLINKEAKTESGIGEMVDVSIYERKALRYTKDELDKAKKKVDELRWSGLEAILVEKIGGDGYLVYYRDKPTSSVKKKRVYDNGGFLEKAKSFGKSVYDKSKPHVKKAYEKTKEAGEKAVEKGKQTIKQQVHQQKKKVAVEVLGEASRLGGLSSKEKSEVTQAKNIVQDYYEAGGKTGTVEVSVSGGVAYIKKCPNDAKCFIVDVDNMMEGDTIKYNGIDYEDSDELINKIKSDFKKSGKKYAIIAVNGGVAYISSSHGVNVIINDFDNDTPKIESGGKPEKIKRCPVGMKVQTIILNKDRFKTAESAKKWAHTQGFKYGSVDEKEDTFRLRQEDPEDFKKKSFRTITMTKGVKSVVGCPIESHTVKSKLASAKDGGKYNAGGKTKYGIHDIEILATKTYLKFLERCLEYFSTDPLRHDIEKEIQLVKDSPEGTRHAVKYYENKTEHKAEIFEEAGAEELADAFRKASQKAAELN